MMLFRPLRVAVNLLPEVMVMLEGDLVLSQAVGGTTGSSPPVALANWLVAVRLSEPGAITTAGEGDGEVWASMRDAALPAEASSRTARKS